VSFAAPEHLGDLVLVAIAFGALLYRRRPRTVTVSSTRIWRGGGKPLRMSRRVRHIARLLAMIASLGAIAALVLAAARPQSAAGTEAVAIVIDVSASMGGGDDSDPLARARKLASSLVRGAAAGRRHLLIAAGAKPRLVAGPTTDAALIERGLAALVATDGAADRHAAVELAAMLLRNEARARIEMIHDGSTTRGLPVQAPPWLRLTAHDVVARDRDNVGVSLFAVADATDPVDPDERVVTVAVATSSAATRTVHISLLSDSEPIEGLELSVPPHGEARAQVRLVAPAGTLSAGVAAIDGVPDTLEADDGAAVVLTSPGAASVWLVAPDEPEAEAASRLFFIEHALAAATDREIRRVTAADLPAVPPPGSVVVVTDGQAIRRCAAPTLFLGMPGRGWPVRAAHHVLAADRETRLRWIDSGDELTRGVDLSAATINEAVAATVGRGARALMDLDGGTVLGRGEDTDGPWVWIGLDPARSDVVLRVAWPVLIANAMVFLGGRDGARIGQTIPPGEIAMARETRPPEGVELHAGPILPGLSPSAALAVLALLLLVAEGFAFWRRWT